jgi:hypothetical protein
MATDSKDTKDPNRTGRLPNTLLNNPSPTGMDLSSDSKKKETTQSQSSGLSTPSNVAPPPAKKGKIGKKEAPSTRPDPDEPVITGADQD